MIDKFSAIEIGAVGVFGYMVVLELLKMIKQKMVTPEKAAQEEFYKSFTEFQIEWRHATGSIEKIKETSVENKSIQEMNFRELRHGQRTLQNTIQILHKENQQ